MSMSVKFEQTNPSNEIKQNNKTSSLVIVSIRFRYSSDLLYCIEFASMHNST